MKLYTKLFLVLSFGFLIFLITLSVFPDTFSKRRPNDFHFPLIKPNSGLNLYTIFNDQLNSIEINYFDLVISEKTIHLIDEKVTILPNEKFVGNFIIESVPINEITDSNIRLIISTTKPIKKLDINFNNNSNPIRLKRNGKILSSSIKK